VKDPNYCTPEELKHSPELIEVPDVVETIKQAPDQRHQSDPRRHTAWAGRGQYTSEGGTRVQP